MTEPRLEVAYIKIRTSFLDVELITDLFLSILP